MTPTYLPQTLTSLLTSDPQPSTTPTANTSTAIPVVNAEEDLLQDLLGDHNLLQFAEEELQKVMLELSTPQMAATPLTEEEDHIISSLLLPMQEQIENLGEFNAHLDALDEFLHG